MATRDSTRSFVPPQNTEAEEAVLGAMLVSASAIDPVVLEVHLKPEDFYRDRHRAIYAAILHLHEVGDAVDSLTVCEALSQRGELEQVGGRDLVTSLAAAAHAPGNARYHADIVKQHALLRRLDETAKLIQQSVAERGGEPRELIEDAERLLFKVAHDDRAADFRSIEQVLLDEWDRLQLLHEQKQELIGTPSGFRDLDRTTGGFQAGNLIIVAARPSIGKSTLVCNIAENVVLKHAKPVALFSLEMSETELAQRFLASQARISNDQLRKGTVSASDWQKVIDANNVLHKAPLWIDDSSDLGLLELRAKARRLHAQEAGKGGLGLVIVDYIQLMRAEDPRANRVEQVGQFSRGLKILSRELGVPVIAVSQLSRAPEQRPDKRPILSDLRESGCLTGGSRVFLPDEGVQAPIAELCGRTGFRVMALDPDSWKLERRPVTNAFSTGIKRVHRLATRLGREIRATANHRFLTVDGWRRLDELRPKDRIALPRALPESATPDDITDLDWDRIESIERDREEEVYDLTVDGLHNFVAEGIVVHNSIEQDADVVAFLYRDEYYDPDTEDQGIAELIVAKHRNGPIGKVRLVFLDRYPKFADMARSGERPIVQRSGEGPPIEDLGGDAFGDDGEDGLGSAGEAF